MRCRAGLTLGAIVLAAVLPFAASGGAGQGTVAAAPTLTARQAHGISVVVRFLDAFNTGNFRLALSSFTNNARFARDIGVSDCDYRHRKSVSYKGRQAVAAWLRQRIADRDRLTMFSIRLLSTDPPTTYDRGAAVEYSGRTNNTLRALGFPHGIRPQLSTKISFTRVGPVRIMGFGNAGNDAACVPTP